MPWSRKQAELPVIAGGAGLRPLTRVRTYAFDACLQPQQRHLQKTLGAKADKLAVERFDAELSQGAGGHFRDDEVTQLFNHSPHLD